MPTPSFGTNRLHGSGGLSMPMPVCQDLEHLGQGLTFGAEFLAERFDDRPFRRF
jgi:hypothetical protein